MGGAGTSKLEQSLKLAKIGIVGCFLNVQSEEINYDISILISLNLYIVHYVWQCYNLEAPAKTRGK